MNDYLRESLQDAYALLEGYAPNCEGEANTLNRIRLVLAQPDLRGRVVEEAIKYRRRYRATDGKEFVPTDDAEPLVTAIDDYLRAKEVK